LYRTLYSENVVQEPESTEVVDRESIADLATTRRQWESIFHDPTTSQPAPKPTKKSTPKWQVRMPYTEKTPTGQTSSTNAASSEDGPVSGGGVVEVEEVVKTTSSMDSGVDMESAIEREIRLALEREESLKKEKELRHGQAPPTSSQAPPPSSTTQAQLSSMESSQTDSELQPSFHEMTEADRGSEFMVNEQRAIQEDALQEESLQKSFHGRVR
jgi:hypothetical protein